MPVTIVVRKIVSEAALERSGGGEATTVDDIAQLPITRDGPRVLLGRSSGCDVRLPDASVSARHASIRARDAGYVVVDEGSTNGTYLNGEKLAAHAPRGLHSGDNLQLGRVRVEVRIGAARPSPREFTQRLALAIVGRSMGDKGIPPPTLTVTEGPDAGASMVVVGEEPRAIGRDPRCSLRLSDRSLPPIAVDVAVVAGQVRVCRRDERIDVKLGEHSLDVGASIPWVDGGVLSIGATRLQLDDSMMRALSESALGDDEQLPPQRQEKSVQAESTEGGATERASGPELLVSSTIAPASLPPQRGAPKIDRRRTWRSATLTFEMVALVFGILVLGASIVGLYVVFRR